MWAQCTGLETALVSFLLGTDFCTVSPASALGKGEDMAINNLGVDDCSVILAFNLSMGKATGMLHSTGMETALVSFLHRDNLNWVIPASTLGTGKAVGVACGSLETGLLANLFVSIWTYLTRVWPWPTTWAFEMPWTHTLLSPLAQDLLCSWCRTLTLWV